MSRDEGAYAEGEDWRRTHNASWHGLVEKRARDVRPTDGNVRKGSDLGTERLDPVWEHRQLLRIFSNILDIIASHIGITLSPSYITCISCFSILYTTQCCKELSSAPQDSRLPAKYGLCATTSTSTHHKSSSHTCYSMVFGCCARKRGRSRREEGGCARTEQRGNTIEGAAGEEGQGSRRAQGTHISQLDAQRQGNNNRLQDKYLRSVADFRNLQERTAREIKAAKTSPSSASLATL